MCLLAQKIAGHMLVGYKTTFYMMKAHTPAQTMTYEICVSYKFSSQRICSIFITKEHKKLPVSILCTYMNWLYSTLQNPNTKWLQYYTNLYKTCKLVAMGSTWYFSTKSLTVSIWLWLVASWIGWFPSCTIQNKYCTL